MVPHPPSKTAGALFHSSKDIIDINHSCHLKSHHPISSVLSNMVKSHLNNSEQPSKLFIPSYWLIGSLEPPHVSHCPLVPSLLTMCMDAFGPKR